MENNEQFFKEWLSKAKDRNEEKQIERHLHQIGADGYDFDHQGKWDIDNEGYHSFFGYSASHLKRAIKSTSHFFAIQPIQERARHFDIGIAFEEMLLEPEKWDENLTNGKYVIFNPENRPEPNKTFASKENKQWKKDLEENADLVLTGTDFGIVQKMLKSAQNNIAVTEMNKDALVQQTYFWRDSDTNILLKTRPDVVKYRSENSVIINDVKTTDDASPEEFSKSFAKFNYGLQAVTQVDGVKSALGVDVDYYTYTVVEKTPPYSTQVYTLSEEDLEFYRIAYKKALQRIKIALEQPNTLGMGYGERSPETGGILQLQVPFWHKRDIRNSLTLENENDEA